MSRILVDTGPLVAILTEKDSHHATCTEQLRKLEPPLYTCWPVITEAAYLLRRDRATMQHLLRAFDIGFLSLLPLDQNAASWIAKFLDQYRDLNPQLADAALMYLAEQEGIDTIFTLDRRDFPAMRLSNGKSLMLLPDQVI